MLNTLKTDRGTFAWKYTICKVIARWLRSTHDSTIFNNPPLCDELENDDYGSNSLLAILLCMQVVSVNNSSDFKIPNKEACHTAHVATRNVLVF